MFAPDHSNAWYYDAMMQIPLPPASPPLVINTDWDWTYDSWGCDFYSVTITGSGGAPTGVLKIAVSAWYGLEYITTYHTLQAPGGPPVTITLSGMNPGTVSIVAWTEDPLWPQTNVYGDFSIFVGAF
jgi:hypothetical protein